MYLLNTTTLVLHSFFGKNIPEYAILSHRWDGEEALFQDLRDGRGASVPSYAKIQGCCAQAKKDGWSYAWIDSVCVDKSSSAELSEAINSMYQWYKDAKVCYVFLSDVDSTANVEREMANSEWFKRGWTLQELLAPETVVFFDKNWVQFGTKDCLRDIISSITGIREDRLFSLGDACIAEKMSWASYRDTTRVEDEAYCLMGIFDVNMPLLYGEGRKAFRRLQLEILQASDDESLFSWNPQSEWSSVEPCSDILAATPSSSASSKDIRRSKPPTSVQSFFEGSPSPFTMTNKGLHISFFLIPRNVLQKIYASYFTGVASDAAYVAVLFSLTDSSNKSPTILLRRSQSDLSSADVSDWTMHRVFQPRWLFLDLAETHNQCLSWIEENKLLPSASLIRNKRLFVQCNPHQKPWRRSLESSARRRILVTVTPSPAESQEVHCFHRSQTSPKFRLLDQQSFIATNSLSDMYFTDDDTQTAILLIEKAQSFGNPRISLLHLSTVDVQQAIDSRRIFKFWKTDADLGDRVSCSFGNSKSISASIRRAPGGLEYQHIIDVEISSTSVLRWPTSTRLRETNETLIRSLMDTVGSVDTFEGRWSPDIVH